MNNKPVDATQSERPASPVGPAIILVGAAGFVVSCFLPFYGSVFSGDEASISLYRINVTFFPGDGSASKVGGFVQLFAGVAIIASIAILLLRKRPQRWALPAMVAAVAVWSVWRFGMLLSASIFPAPRQWATGRCSTVGLVTVGTVVSALAARPKASVRNELDD